MINRLIFVALLIPSHVAVSADFESNLVSGIEEILDSAAEEQKYPGVSLAIVYKDYSYSGQRGYADVAEQKNVDDKTIFRMYSLTKGVTGILEACRSS